MPPGCPERWAREPYVEPGLPLGALGDSQIFHVVLHARSPPDVVPFFREKESARSCFSKLKVETSLAEKNETVGVRN